MQFNVLYTLVVPAELNYMYQVLQVYSCKFIVKSNVGFAFFLKESKFRSKFIKY